ATQAHVRRVTTRLFDELAANNERTARTTGRVIDAQARSRFEDADHEPDDIAWSVEVAALLTRRLGKHINQKLIGRTEQVRELEVFIAQAITVKVAHQVLARVIRDETLIADRAHKADVVEDVFERVAVRLAQCAEGFIEHAAKRLGRVVDA